MNLPPTRSVEPQSGFILVFGWLIMLLSGFIVLVALEYFADAYSVYYQVTNQWDIHPSAAWQIKQGAILRFSLLLLIAAGLAILGRSFLRQKNWARLALAGITVLIIPLQIGQIWLKFSRLFQVESLPLDVLIICSTVSLLTAALIVTLAAWLVCKLISAPIVALFLKTKDPQKP